MSDRLAYAREAYVFWDFEAKEAIADASAEALVNDIRNALALISPTISSIKAFCDFPIALQARPRLLRSLSDHAISVVDCPQQCAFRDVSFMPHSSSYRDGKSTVESSIQLELFETALQRPPPVLFAVIAREQAFTRAAAVLRNRQYTVLFMDMDDYGRVTAPSGSHLSRSIASWTATTSELASRSHPVSRVFSPSRDDYHRHPLTLTLSSRTSEDLVGTAKPPRTWEKEAFADIVTSPTQCNASEGAIGSQADDVVPARLPVVLPAALAHRILANTSVLKSFIEAGIVIPLLLLNKDMRARLEPELYKRICIDSIPAFIKLKNTSSHMLQSITIVDVDLPVRLLYLAFMATAVSNGQDDACIRLLQLCTAQLRELTLTRGHWDQQGPPLSLRSALCRFPGLQKLTLRSVQNANVDISWLILDLSLPLFGLRTLSIGHLHGRPKPLYGTQLPLESSTGIKVAVFPALKRLYITEASGISSAELARLILVCPNLEELSFRDGLVSPATIFACMLQHRDLAEQRRLMRVSLGCDDWCGRANTRGEPELRLNLRLKKGTRGATLWQDCRGQAILAKMAPQAGINVGAQFYEL